MGDKHKCDFCKILRDKLDKDIQILQNSYLSQKYFKDNFKIRDAVSICRGFNLCGVHTITIKKDNKLRLGKGMDIPNSLEIVKKFLLADI